MQPTAVFRHTAGTAHQFADNKLRLVLAAMGVKGREQEPWQLCAIALEACRLFLRVERMAGGFWGADRIHDDLSARVFGSMTKY